jgi:two-component system chemotaxis response regulator CheV
MEGVLDLRGDIIPVIHLPKWLGKYDPQFQYERIIIVEFNMLRAGLLVNRVHRIHHIPYEKFTPPTVFMRGGKEIVTLGVIRNEGRIVMMLDYENLLAEIDPETVTDMTEFRRGSGGGRILIAEDSGAVRNIMRQALTQTGYTVLEAENGQDAMQLLEEHYQQCQINGINITAFLRAVVTDVEMPLLDGLSLISKLKSDKRFRDIPAIIFSSTASDQRIEEWKSMGADECIAKPQISLLLSRINELASSS